MTVKSDWEFRAEYLKNHADSLERKADKIKMEAARYRGLSEQARNQSHGQEAT